MLANIQGIDDLTIHEVQTELLKGGKFVRFPYCISVIAMTFKLSSDIILVRQGESPFIKGRSFFLRSLFLGWWGIPFGPIYTIQSLYYYARGGKDVTEDTMTYLQNPPSPFYRYCPGCSYFAYGRAVCTKHHIALQAYPERFHEECNGKDYLRIPVLVPRMQCYACGANLTLSDVERKAFKFVCPACKHAYDFQEKP